MKLHFENLSIFFKKSKRTHMLGPPPTGPLFNFVRFSMTTPPPHPSALLNELTF